MKEFEKWWKSDTRQHTMCADVAAKDAWKAALKWVLKSYKGAFFFRRYMIEKELRDE